VSTEARLYTERDRDDWDAVVRRSRSGHFFFLRDYLDYHADRFADSSLLVYEEGRLRSVLPANRVGDDAVSHGGLTFGGVLSDSSMSANGMLRAVESILERFRSVGVTRLVYKPVPHAYHLVPAEDDLYALYRAGARLVGRDLSAAIRLDERLPYTKGRRSALKRGRAAGISVEASERFEEFIDLATANLERHGAVPTHSGFELAALGRRFPENIRLFTAVAEEEVIAGVVVYETPVLAHTQYIASSQSGRELAAVDVLIDHLIERYAGTKRWFDFGISTENGGATLNEGLARNKESYGARALVYDRYLIDL
jgi:hypothetical protein